MANESTITRYAAAQECLVSGSCGNLRICLVVADGERGLGLTFAVAEAAMAARQPLDVPIEAAVVMLNAYGSFEVVELQTTLANAWTDAKGYDCGVDDALGAEEVAPCS